MREAVSVAAVACSYIYLYDAGYMNHEPCSASDRQRLDALPSMRQRGGNFPGTMHCTPAVG